MADQPALDRKPSHASQSPSTGGGERRPKRSELQEDVEREESGQPWMLTGTEAKLLGIAGIGFFLDGALGRLSPLHSSASFSLFAVLLRRIFPSIRRALLSAPSPSPNQALPIANPLPSHSIRPLHHQPRRDDAPVPALRRGTPPGEPRGVRQGGSEYRECDWAVWVW